ncbi:MAG: hypothetical protein ACRDDC_02325 [Tannerellaceae bacterium]
MSKQSAKVFESSPAFLTLPETTAAESWYLHCFSKLETSRQVGMVVGGIPLSEILTFKQYLDEDEDFVDYMLHCDSVVLEMLSKKEAAKPKSS